MALLGHLGIEDILDYVADANFITHHKPHPEIFLKAADGVGVAPSQCLAFEDAMAGLQAINRAGMFSIGIGDPTILTEANIVISGLEDFTLEMVASSGQV